jgi:DNA-binding response OmpR family regulator
MNGADSKTSLAERVEKLIRAAQAPARHRYAPREDQPALESLAALAESTSEAEAPPAPQTGVPKRVLIVEPDLLHRQVLTRVIENAGYTVETAAGSADAIAAFQASIYSLVLIDCDDPEVNGIVAAAAMRQAENGSTRTPLVAITAVTDRGQRQRRKAAGIDNYLAKPILRENVESVLARYAPLHTAARPAAYLALDRHRVEELDQLAGDRPELLCEWIEFFLASAPELVDRMRSAQEDGNVQALREAALQLRSRSGQMGALRVQEVCGIIGALCESGSLAGVESLIPEAAIAADRASRELRSFERDVRSGVRLAAAGTGRKSAPSPPECGILLVQADPLVSRFLITSLEAAGFPVTHAITGRAALDELAAKAFSAAIVDLAVPEIDGYGILSEIRARPGDSIPVMILSARRQEQDILRAFELGADDYATIPFSPMEVVARVRRLIRQGAHVA